MYLRAERDQRDWREGGRDETMLEDKLNNEKNVHSRRTGLLNIKMNRKSNESLAMAYHNQGTSDNEYSRYSRHSIVRCSDHCYFHAFHLEWSVQGIKCA